MVALRTVDLNTSYLASPAGGPHIVVDPTIGPPTIQEPTATTAGVVTASRLERNTALAIGDGVSLDFRLGSSAGTLRDAFRISSVWGVATDGAEFSEVVFSGRVAGLFTEALRFRNVGLATAIVAPLALNLNPNGITADGLQLTTIGTDVYLLPLTSSSEFFLGNTVADPSVDLNRATSRAMSLIPLGTTITALGGGSGNWINFGSNVVLDYANATISGLLATSGQFRFRQSGTNVGAGNLFKNSGIFTNEIGSSVSLGSQYTYVHIGTYRADGAGGAFAQANLFHRNCLFQIRWEAINGATMALTTANTGGFINPQVASGVTITNFRSWEFNPGAFTGTVVDHHAIYFANLSSGTNSTAAIRSLVASGATRRFINHTGTAQSDFGGAIGLGSGATIDVVLSRGAANRLDLASGDSFRIINGNLEHQAGSVGFHGVTPAALSAAYTPANVTPDRAYDANATTINELSDVLGTVIADLQLKGLLG